MERKLFLLAALAICLGSGAANTVQAQSFPTHAIKIVTPFPAGQGPDVLLRNVADKLSASLGQPVVIENKPGASGFLAFQAVKSAAPDGYTLVQMDSYHVGTQPYLFSKLPYDAFKDFDPVTPLVRNDFFVVVSASSKWTTMGDLIKAASAKPGAVTYGSWGVATPAHLGGLLLESATGTYMAHVPFKETAQLYTAVANGDVDWAIGSAASAGPLQHAGKVRFLAATGKARIKGYESIPTAAESGVPANWTVGGWNGLLAPKGTPPQIIQRLNAEITKAMNAPDMQDKLSVFTYEPYTMAPEAMRKLMQQEVSNWGPVIKANNISLD